MANLGRAFQPQPVLVGDQAVVIFCWKKSCFLYIWSKRYHFSGRLVGQVGGWKNLKSTVTTEFECYYFDQPNHNDILFEVNIQVVDKITSY